MTYMIKKMIALLIEALCRISTKNPGTSPDKGGTKTILIFSHMGIGNMIMFSPMIKNLRRHFINSKIILVFNSKNGAERVLEGSGVADESIVLRSPDTAIDIVRKVIRLLRSKPDIVISRFNSDQLSNALITALCRPKFRVGHVSSGGWTGRFDYLQNVPVTMKDDEHEIDRYLRLAEALNVPIVDRSPFFHVEAQDRDEAASFLANNMMDSPYVTIQIGTSPDQRWKQWPTQYWKELVQILAERDVRVVVVGSPAEADEIKALLGNIESPAGLVIAAGSISLKATAHVIELSTLLVCNDSGLMHIAVARKTPVVALFGPTDHTRTAPAGDIHTILRANLGCSPCYRLKGTEKVMLCKHRACMISITPGEVANVTLDILGKSRGGLAIKATV